MSKSYLEHLLGANERILLIARQHWFLLIRAILFEISLIILILAGVVVAALQFPNYAILCVAIGFILILIPIASMTHDILQWTNRQFVVTNLRVIQLAGIINKDVTDSSLEKVNDVKLTQSFLGRMYDYGDVEILTASELGVNLFRRIEHPIRFKTVMLNAKEQLEHGSSPFPPSQDIPSLISRLGELRTQGILSEAEFQEKKAELLKKL
jgi:uncharacterized membrane protein YdbT with pleckstrin-like domain